MYCLSEQSEITFRSPLRQSRAGTENYTAGEFAIYRKLDWLDKEDIIRRVVTREFGRFVEYYSNAPEPAMDLLDKGLRINFVSL